MKFVQELEYLQDLSLMKNSRVRSLTGLEMAINSRWALKTAMHVHFDNDPTPGFRETDTITETSLIYKLQERQFFSCIKEMFRYNKIFSSRELRRGST